MRFINAVKSVLTNMNQIQASFFAKIVRVSCLYQWDILTLICVLLEKQDVKEFLPLHFQPLVWLRFVPTVCQQLTLLSWKPVQIWTDIEIIFLKAFNLLLIYVKTISLYLHVIQKSYKNQLIRNKTWVLFWSLILTIVHF